MDMGNRSSTKKPTVDLTSKGKPQPQQTADRMIGVICELPVGSTSLKGPLSIKGPLSVIESSSMKVSLPFKGIHGSDLTDTKLDKVDKLDIVCGSLDSFQNIYVNPGNPMVVYGTKASTTNPPVVSTVTQLQQSVTNLSLLDVGVHPHPQPRPESLQPKGILKDNVSLQPNGPLWGASLPLQPNGHLQQAQQPVGTNGSLWGASLPLQQAQQPVWTNGTLSKGTTRPNLILLPPIVTDATTSSSAFQASITSLSSASHTTTLPPVHSTSSTVSRMVKSEDKREDKREDKHEVKRENKRRDKREIKVKRGRFIVWEGVDFTGKSTQIDLFIQSLKGYDVPFAKLDFPYRHVPSGKQIYDYHQQMLQFDNESDVIEFERKYAREIHELLLTNCIELQSLIRLYLLAGYTVVCERYYYTNIFQSLQNGIPIENALSCEFELIAPDLVFNMHMTADEYRTIYSKKVTKSKIEYEVQIMDKVELFLNRSNMTNSWHTIDASDRNPTDISEYIWCLYVSQLGDLSGQPKSPSALGKGVASISQGAPSLAKGLTLRSLSTTIEEMSTMSYVEGFFTHIASYP